MQQQIFQIAYQLSAEGKTPSVALIKARLSTPVALPVVIQALQKWKASPQLGKPTEQTSQTQHSPSPSSTEETGNIDSNMASRLSALEHKVDKILALVEALAHR